MSFKDDLDKALLQTDTGATQAKDWVQRFKAQVTFASGLAAARPANQAARQKLILKAARTVNAALASGSSAPAACQAGEKILAPLAKAAKEYTVHCLGHAHIDMNWLWNWPETVAVTHDTFSTVIKLMDEFPEFRFSQSQASVYQIMKDYLPELYERVKEKVAAGQWEVTASQWVEGDRNMAAGETLCRHMLYTRRFLQQELGLPFDAVKIDWECDTFGHPSTLPGILQSAGVRRYYFHRGDFEGPRLFWWKGRDGSKVLARNDWPVGYNGVITPAITDNLFAMEASTGLKDDLYVYGVGDHGGGPTRADIQKAIEMNTWPVFPNIRLSTSEAYFHIVEQQGKKLPVQTQELNFVFEGCYTSQSNVKRGNRKSECALTEAETFAVLGAALTQVPYPAQALYSGWKNTMFNQFHDILPGSGLRTTYDHAQGLYQEVFAQTQMVKTRTLRQIAAKVDTAASANGLMADDGAAGSGVGQGIGYGAGNEGGGMGVTTRSAGAVGCEPFVVFNPSPWKRDALVTARIWNRQWPDGQVVVQDEQGKRIAAQVIESQPIWCGHTMAVVFPASGIDALGYRSFTLGRAGDVPAASNTCKGDRALTMENEFYTLTFEQSSGAILHLVDKKSGLDLVPPGERLGVLEHWVEAPCYMNAWCMGQPRQVQPLLNGTMDMPHTGPHLSQVRVMHKVNDSSITMTISLMAGSPRIDFAIEMDWLERGTSQTGVPGLKVAFPINVTPASAKFEAPNGWVERPVVKQKLPSYTYRLFTNGYRQGMSQCDPQPGEEVCQKWIDLTGKAKGVAAPVGATLVNDSKYGCSILDNVMRLTLVRSTYDPEPLPEMGHHSIRFGLRPHVGRYGPADATREGYDFNLPLSVVSTTVQKGTLPPRKGFVEIQTPNIMLSGLKKAEDDNSLVIRLYETQGKATVAGVQLDESLLGGNPRAVATDTLERPLKSNIAELAGGVLSVPVPAFGTVTVKIERA